MGPLSVDENRYGDGARGHQAQRCEHLQRKQYGHPDVYTLRGDK